MSLRDKLAGRLPKAAKPAGPVWKGPEQDGVTFSLLSRFLTCRERFRCLVVDGLKPAPQFNHRIEYGSMWHACEEELAAQGEWYAEGGKLEDYCRDLMQKYPMQSEDIAKWYRVCRTQFPIYVDYWHRHPDVQERTPLMQEQVFDVPYVLPSGRTVRLRGKFDSVDVIGTGKAAGIYLQENKTKGDVDVLQMQRQLTFDLQTMLYLTALQTWQTQPKQYRLGGEGIPRGTPIRGVRYNVVRRPLSGGKGSIVRHKPTKSNPRGESEDEYYARLGGVIKENAGEFFWRWKVEVTPHEVEQFQRRCLNPLLENLCDWWTESSWHSPFTKSGNHQHWQHPFGVRNAMDEGGSTDLDEYIRTGSTAGLVRTTELFPELT